MAKSKINKNTEKRASKSKTKKCKSKKTKSKKYTKKLKGGNNNNNNNYNGNNGNNENETETENENKNKNKKKKKNKKTTKTISSENLIDFDTLTENNIIMRMKSINFNEEYRYIYIIFYIELFHKIFGLEKNEKNKKKYITDLYRKLCNYLNEYKNTQEIISKTIDKKGYFSNDLLFNKSMHGENYINNKIKNTNIYIYQPDNIYYKLIDKPTYDNSIKIIGRSRVNIMDLYIYNIHHMDEIKNIYFIFEKEKEKEKSECINLIIETKDNKLNKYNFKEENSIETKEEITYDNKIHEICVKFENKLENVIITHGVDHSKKNMEEYINFYKEINDIIKDFLEENNKKNKKNIKEYIENNYLDIFINFFILKNHEFSKLKENYGIIKDNYEEKTSIVRRFLKKLPFR